MELPIFPLNSVLFPGGRLPLHIFEERYKQMINTCIDEKRPFGVCLIREGSEVGRTAAKPFDVGTTAHISEVQRLEEGRLNIACTGGERFRIKHVTQETPYLAAEVELLPPQTQDDERTRDLAQTAAALFSEYVRLNLAMTNQWARSIEMPTDAGSLADYIGGRIAIDPWAKQRLLELLSPVLRLEAEIQLLSEAIHQLQGHVQVARAQRWMSFGVMN